MDAVRSNLLSINRNVNLNRVAAGLEVKHVEVVEINGQSINICDTIHNRAGAFTVT